LNETEKVRVNRLLGFSLVFFWAEVTIKRVSREITDGSQIKVQAKEIAVQVVCDFLPMTDSRRSRSVEIMTVS
jgi:hypothetical protein